MALHDGQVEPLEVAIGQLLNSESFNRWNDQTRSSFREQWIAKVSADTGVEDGLALLVLILENVGIHLDERFGLYALKGMLTLLAEPYTDRKTQKEILSETVRDLVEEKKPFFIRRKLQGICSKLLNRTGQ